MKSVKGVQTIEQKAFQKAMELNGASYWLIRSLPELLSKLICISLTLNPLLTGSSLVRLGDNIVGLIYFLLENRLRKRLLSINL